MIWIDANIDNKENVAYRKELSSIGSIRLRLAKNVDKAIKYLKNIDFHETKIIVSGRLYPEFIKSFKENIIDIYVAPKIVVFTRNKQKFLEYNKDYLDEDNIFYSSGGVATSFEEIKKLLLNECILNKLDKPDDTLLTFEYIDSIEKLILPLFFKALIDNTSNQDLQKYTNLLYETYSKEKEQIKKLLGSIVSLPKIPIEILSKYYAKLYTADSTFHRDINKDLGLNKKEKYLKYIKTLYEGVKLKSLPLASNNILYRGSKISKEEINIIKSYLKKKIKDLPSSIVFSRSFLSFSKDKKVAEKFLKNKNNNLNLSKVLFVLEKDDNIGFNLSTHGDIEKISFFPDEREVLFFPFSSFEIKDIKDINIGNEKGYEIKLLYLGKYLKEIKNNKNLIINENKIPDSEFKHQLTELGLIKKEIIEKINIKNLYNEYNKYEKNINNENNIGKNIIKGIINIGKDDLNKDIQIINSYENLGKTGHIPNYRVDWENEKEIKDNIEIRIKGKTIDFSYTYKFEKEGKYNIEYLFKNNIIDTNSMFSYCLNLINLDLSNFNTQNVTNMSYMFQGCGSLINLNLSNFNTQNVTYMYRMFYGCELLTNLNLTNFNTQNVTNMCSMFVGCKSLTNLNLSNFNTQNVTDMYSMFSQCESLTNLNLSNFNTQNVTDMRGMFAGCKSLTNLNLSNFNTQNVTDIQDMFAGCKSLTNLNLSNFNTQNVSYMNGMFWDCESLTNLNLSNFNTQNVTIMYKMFCGCELLTNLNLSNFNTQNVTDMAEMFYGCKSLTNLNLSNFNTQNVTDMAEMFYDCKSLKEVNINTKDAKILNEFKKYI